jgi:hypothetical protein
MVLELDISLIDIIKPLTINQLVFLNLVLDVNQKSIKHVSQLVSLVSEAEIQDLINRGYIVKEISNEAITYLPTDNLIKLVERKVTMFDEFYAAYPQVVIRPDGTKSFLRANVNNCRKKYNSIVGKSKATHQHLMECLKFQLNDLTMTGRMGYMKTMWKWLTQCEWESLDEQMKSNEITEANTYGTTLI